MHTDSLISGRARRWRHRGPGHGRGHHGRGGPGAELHGLRGLFHHGRGGRSVRRGNVRFAILAVLNDRPMHGYDVIRELESRTRGRWRPSAGSVYPTLQLLEDEGLVTGTETDGRRTYTLTDAGRAVADEHRIPDDGWLDADAGGQPSLPELAGRLIAAASELERVGTDAARDSARTALVDARRHLYRLLADDEGASAE
jgi:DNA-binding PadR family transcriptional regulator